MSNLWWLGLPAGALVAIYIHQHTLRMQMRAELIEDVIIAEMYDIDAEYEALIDSEL